MTLTPEQIDDFVRDGFVVVPQAIDPAWCEEQVQQGFRRLGIDEHDPSSFHVHRTHMPITQGFAYAEHAPAAEKALRQLLGQYEVRDIVWVQEEPWNMGAWSFVQARIRGVLPKGGRLRYAGRREAASPAAGSYRLHQQQEAEFVHEAFARRARRRR